MKVALLSHEGGGISSVCYGLAYSISKRKIETRALIKIQAPQTKE